MIKRFFLGFWRALNFARTTLANVGLVAFLAVLAFFLVHQSHPAIPDKATLVINISGTVVEQDSLSGRGVAVTSLLQGSEPQTSLHDVIRALELAKNDGSVQGVYMVLDDLEQVGLASVREIGEAMKDFRNSGKRITVWSSSYAQRQYAIAAYANEVYLHPMGQVLLTGIGSQRFYWGEALKKLGVTVHVFKAGAFKSFPEVFVLKGPSEDSLAADRFWMTDAWEQLTESIQSSRGLMPGAVQSYIDTLAEKLKAAAGDMSAVALNANLVDGVKSNDEVLDMLVERQGGVKGKDRLRTVDFLDYLDVRDNAPNKGNGIGVVTIEGEISDGSGSVGQVGARTAVRLIREARLDPEVKALVVRVDSPGGSAVASEMIRRELEIVRKSGKPVVVSMGDYAASGGYWLSLAASRIVADPASITGSIGVFGMMPTFEKSLEKLSVGVGGAETAWLAKSRSLALPMDPRFEQIMELTVGRTYEDFVRLVSGARKISTSRVMDIAQGRVYTGRQAKDRGLADLLGGMEVAKREAKKLAKLKANAPVYWFSEEEHSLLSWLGRYVAKMPESLSAKILPLLIKSGGFSDALRVPERIMTLTKTPGSALAHCLCTPE